MSAHHPFKGDHAEHTHIDWRHGPLSPAKDDAMSEEQFDKLMGAIKTLAKGLDGLAEGQKVLADQIAGLVEPAHKCDHCGTSWDAPVASCPACGKAVFGQAESAEEPRASESAPKVTASKPKASPKPKATAKAHPKS